MNKEDVSLYKKIYKYTYKVSKSALNVEEVIVILDKDNYRIKENNRILKKENLDNIIEENKNIYYLYTEKKDDNKVNKMFTQKKGKTMQNVKDIFSTNTIQKNQEKKIVWFTDLDNTLIYSNKKIKDLNKVVVEKIDNKDFSFMSKYNYQTFQDINKKAIVIPTTTRNLNQYKRLNFLEKQKYAIINNGATILIDGIPDMEWNKRVQDGYSKDDLIKLKNEISNQYFVKVRSYQDFFLVIKDNKRLPTLEYEGYTTYKTEKKIYIVPNNINKESAVKYLINKYFKDYYVVTSGDSIMDEKFIKLGNSQIFKKDKKFIYKINHSYE